MKKVFLSFGLLFVEGFLFIVVSGILGKVYSELSIGGMDISEWVEFSAVGSVLCIPIIVVAGMFVSNFRK